MKFINFAAIASIAILTACGNSDKSSLSFSSYEFSVEADGADSDSLRNVMHDFDGRWSVTVSGVLPERLGDKDISELRDSLICLANLRTDDSGKLEVSLPAELKPLGKNENGSKDDAGNKENDKKGSTQPGSIMTHDLSLDLLTPRIAVFKSYTYTYPEGAAHPAFSNGYLNYDIEKGKIISRSDMFTPGYESMLRPAIYNRLTDEGLEMLVEQGEFPLPTQFRLTNDGVEFIYGIYEIAPYSAGEPRVFFSYPELYSIMKPAAKELTGQQAND